MSSSSSPSDHFQELVASQAGSIDAASTVATPTHPYPTDDYGNLSPVPLPTSYYDDDSDADDSDADDKATGGDRDHGVLNYYFLLLAVLIILILVVWFAILRRRRKKALHFQSSRQAALAQDVQGWGGRSRFGPGRWRTPGTREPRPEEGLNDRGEAPPPYMPNEPEAAHTRREGESGRQSIELRHLAREETKPPEYL